MKHAGARRARHLAWVTLAGLVACGVASRRPVLRAQGDFSLTVVNGYGGGHLLAGRSAYVEAGRWPEGQAFAGWVSDAPELTRLDREAPAHYRFPMPAHDTTITATWHAAPTWALEPLDLGGATAYRQAPPEPGGRGGRLGAVA